NNAGMGSQYVGIADADLDQFDRTIAVHLRGVLATMKHAVPIMAAQGAGGIITVASINGTRAGLGGLYYSLAKAASVHLARCARSSSARRASGSTPFRLAQSLPGFLAKARVSTTTRQTSIRPTRRPPLPPFSRACNHCLM